MNQFTKLVSAENSLGSVWGKKDYFALLLIPMIFIVGSISQYFSTSHILVGTIDTSLRLIIFIFLVVAYAPMLYRHWRKFKLAWNVRYF